MGKKLITDKNYKENVCENKFYATNDMILTSAVKDLLRREKIEIVYVKCECEINKKEGKSLEGKDLEKEIVAMLVRDFGITDTETIKNIIARIEKELKGV